MTFFRPEEFHCRCGRSECDAPKEISPVLAVRLDDLRVLLARPVVITSGLRCSYWNERQGGTADSEHLTGEAADISTPSSVERYAVLRKALTIFDRAGVGATFVHVGVSTTLGRHVVWTYYPKASA